MLLAEMAVVSLAQEIRRLPFDDNLWIEVEDVQGANIAAVHNDLISWGRKISHMVVRRPLTDEESEAGYDAVPSEELEVRSRSVYLVSIGSGIDLGNTGHPRYLPRQSYEVNLQVYFMRYAENQKPELALCANYDIGHDSHVENDEEVRQVSEKGMASMNKAIIDFLMNDQLPHDWYGQEAEDRLFDECGISLIEIEGRPSSDS